MFGYINTNDLMTNLSAINVCKICNVYTKKKKKANTKQ